MIEEFLNRLGRISNDPSRIVDYLRLPRKLVRGGPLSNRLGLQAARAVKEQVMWSARSAAIPQHLRAHFDALERDGFVAIENFLPEHEFAEVEADLAEIEKLPKEQFRVVPFGTNYESKIFLVTKRLEYRAFDRYVSQNQTIYDLACALARRQRTYKPHVSLQWVYKPDAGAPHEDVEHNRYLHVDRHYPFLKAFFYLKDVGPDCAPYTFVPGSHKFNWARLQFEYQLGVMRSAAGRNDRAASAHAYRVTEGLARELRDRLGQREVQIVGKKNTVIISNNQGLHRRAEMTGSGPRVSANLDFKFLESPAQRLYPLLRHIETPSATALAY